MVIDHSYSERGNRGTGWNEMVVVVVIVVVVIVVVVVVA